MHTSIPGLSIRRAGGGEVELFEVQDATCSFNGFTCLRHQAIYGGFEFHYFAGKFFQIWRSRYAMRQQMSFVSEGDIPVLELHIPIAGDLSTAWDGQMQQTLRRLQFDIEYAGFIYSETVFDADQYCETLDLHYDIAFVTQFADKYPVLLQFLQDIHSRGRASLLKRAVRFLSPRMGHVVHNILHYDGLAEDAEAFYSEQAALLLEMVLERAMVLKHDYAQRKDIDAAVAVRELMLNNLDHKYTADELSSYTGINVTRLHKCFKELHGATLFDFSQGLRLQHAQQLIRDTSLTLQEIAEQCGYPEHANLTAAFRKRFGISPQQFRSAR